MAWWIWLIVIVVVGLIIYYCLKGKKENGEAFKLKKEEKPEEKPEQGPGPTPPEEGGTPPL